MRPNEQMPQEFSSPLFGGAQPSSVNWKEGLAFRHYLASLRQLDSARGLRLERAWNLAKS
jgi:hypothetical protein